MESTTYGGRILLSGALVALALLVALPAPATAGVYSSGLFQLGDGKAPPGFAGMGKIASTAGQPGPDWADLFDAAGQPVQGYQQRWGGQWATFIADDVSLGAGVDGTACAGSADFVRNAAVSAGKDIGNAYLYGARGTSGPVVYMGFERLAGGAGSVEIELTADHVMLGHGGFGHDVPWTLEGERRLGDVLVRLTFASSGALAAVEVARWDGVAWQGLSGIAGEGCDDAEQLCAVANAEPIAAGPWAAGATIAAGGFVELGVDLGALGASTLPRSIQVRTAEDIAFGYVGEGK